MKTLNTETLTIEEAHIAELKRQNEILCAQVRDMRSLIQTIPSIIANARMDQQEGKQTHYDYTRHANVCKLLIA